MTTKGYTVNGKQANTSLSVKSPHQVRDLLEFLGAKLDACLVIDGESLQVSQKAWLKILSPVIFTLVMLPDYNLQLQLQLIPLL